MYKAVIFDFFGVICNDIGSQWLSGRFDEQELSRLKQEYFLPLDIGERSESELFEMLGAATAQAPEEVREQMYGNILIDSEVVSCIKELRGTYKLGLCSNASREIFDRVTSAGKLTLSDLFDEIVVSGDLKIAKPDPRIFIHTLTVLDASPAETIFIDDNPKNVEAAEELGIRSLLFSGADDLRAHLKEL